MRFKPGFFWVAWPVLCLMAAAILNIAAVKEASRSEKELMDGQKREWRRYQADDAAGVPTTSMAIEFYNQGVEAYQAHDYELAEEALHQSIEMNERNALAHELLGDIALARHDLASSKEHYRKAYLIEPSQARRSKLEKNSKEIGIEDSFLTYEKEPFLIKYKAAEKEDLAKLSELLDGTYRHLKSTLDYTPRSELIVLLYDEQEFGDLFNTPHWVSGLYDGKVRLPAYRWGLLNAMLPALAAHEMTHAFIAELASGKAPAWLNEGLAVYMENQVTPRSLDVLRLAVKTKTVLPLDVMMSEKKMSENQDPIFSALFYEEAFHFVSYLVDTYGLFKIRRLLAEFGKGVDYDQALREIFESGPETLEQLWMAVLYKQFPPPA